MKLNEFLKEVHENAKAHGWWETDRSFSECIVLIHSEWSEALEEARAGRPMHYFPCNAGGLCVDDLKDEHRSCGSRVINPDLPDIPCMARSKKPEGIAVEMMDGVIRILDLFGRYQQRFMYGTVRLLTAATSQANPDLRKGMPLADVLQYTHFLTAQAGSAMLATKDPRIAMKPLEACVGIALWWVQQQGFDPEALLLEKHEYNKTRPYKHGKQF